MLYETHRRMSDNTIAKTNKDKQCYTKHIEVRQTIPWPRPTGTNNVLQNTSKNVRQYHEQNPQGQTMLYKSHRRTFRQYHGQNQQGQTMLYKTHRRTSDNIMAKTNKEKQCYTKEMVER